MEATVLYETDVLGTAYITVDPEYSGPCALECDCGFGNRAPRAVFPNVAEACAAARFAVDHLGGYNRAVVHEAANELPTHLSWDEWAFD